MRRMHLPARRPLVAAAIAAVACCALLAGPAMAAPLPGAIFTTNSDCLGVNLNIYGDKGDVYLDGGPAYPGAAGLPDGSYYVKVTAPDGTLLGTSVGTGNEKPVTVVGGEFVGCDQLAAILLKVSDGTSGYDDTTSPGGEYKVWVSSVFTFDSNSTKTDNFKVRSDGTVPPQEDLPTLHVRKFYGLHDLGESYITGWKVHIQDNISIDRFTPADLILDIDDYTVSEYSPIQTNWLATTPSPVNVSLILGDDKTVEFGNVCTGAGGGLTLGFWSNKNGQALVTSGDLSTLTGMNLVNANGSAFDPSTKTALKNWLLNGNATNMAYMLSVQLATMKLNVLHGFVGGSSLVYGGSTLGFVTVDALMTAADTDLGTFGHNVTVAGSAVRTYQEILKNALDNANNNKTFVQSAPCAFSFAG
jgi:hypothetical protein